MTHKRRFEEWSVWTLPTPTATWRGGGRVHNFYSFRGTPAFSAVVDNRWRYSIARGISEIGLHRELLQLPKVGPKLERTPKEWDEIGKRRYLAAGLFIAGLHHILEEDLFRYAVLTIPPLYSSYWHTQIPSQKYDTEALLEAAEKRFSIPKEAPF